MFPQDPNLSRRIEFFHLDVPADREHRTHAAPQEAASRGIARHLLQRRRAGNLIPSRNLGGPDPRLSGMLDHLNLSNAIDLLPDVITSKCSFSTMWKDMNIREIAAILGCSVGNSKSQLFKARTRLQGTITGSAAQPRSGRKRESNAQLGCAGPARRQVSLRQSLNQTPLISRRRPLETS